MEEREEGRAAGASAAEEEAPVDNENGRKKRGLAAGVIPNLEARV